MSIDIKKITTESRLDATYNIDSMDTIDILKSINNEDKTVPYKVEEEITQLVPLVDTIVECIITKDAVDGTGEPITKHR